jgi:hypothetical protein
MSGWCLGNCAKLTPRERFCSLLAASLSDLDGLGILVGQEAYWEYHHKLCHNLPFGILLSLVLWLCSGQRRKAFFLYLGLFHLHLILDYYGSGPGWEIYYLWPFSQWAVVNLNTWEFYSWQNMSVTLAFTGWMLWIAVKYGRTPFELLMPHLDSELVQWLRRRFHWKQTRTVN